MRDIGPANTRIPTAEEKCDAGFDVDSLSEWPWLLSRDAD